MELKDHIIVGIYPTRERAFEVIKDLKEAGYRSDDISLIGKETEENEIFEESDEKMKKSSAGGAVTGGITGGIGGWLAGATVLTFTGLGPLIVAGPLVMALSGAVLGAGAGGLVGALVGLGMSEDEAIAYEERIKQGEYLLIVKDDKDYNLRNMMQDKPYRHNQE